MKKLGINLNFTFAMVTKMSAKIGWNRKLTVLEILNRIIDIEHTRILKGYLTDDKNCQRGHSTKIGLP